jgi:hypothetical protein
LVCPPGAKLLLMTGFDKIYEHEIMKIIISKKLLFETLEVIQTCDSSIQVFQA